MTGKRQNTPIFQKGKREDLGNSRLVLFLSVPGKVMEQILLETISKHMKGKGWKRQHELTEGKWKPCLTNLIASYHQMNGFVPKGKAEDFVNLHFIKAFDAVPRSLLIAKLLRSALDQWTIGKVEDWLDHQAEMLCSVVHVPSGSQLLAASLSDRHHTPMYFFLLNLSLLDLGSISTTVPKSMANSLRDTRAICYAGCAAQVFFVVFFILDEYSLLTVMAYDRFVAICRPLHYGTLMDSRSCVKMAAAAWASGFLHALLHTANTFLISFCQGNTVDQFFCEIPQILKLSCSNSSLREVGLVVITNCLFFACFIFIVLSYVQIFTAVLRIPSEQGRHKAFSMCLPHLAVVSLFVSTGLFAYLKPPSLSSPALDLVVAVLYSVVPPTVNPLIYSMRNKELKDALRKLIQWVQCQHQ
ncbi:olfactory receptor 14A16-like [Dromaius novaehollandiae]|uniref:olfactory receptor 14A16-like n=1 Tax=Dromaius novaehollandiae TaxID=8790 RepID=UPI00311EC0E6